MTVEAKTKYEPVIGLEVHIQLKTKSKMFCSCDNFSVNADPNANVCPVCLGMPGTLPVANKQAIEWIRLLGVALGGKVVSKFNFERKNYFYPDLPKAYQITSSTNYPVEGGFLEVETKDGQKRKVSIHHIHMEEDAGKLTHDKGDYSLVDLNRAGTPLVELVTDPDLYSAAEAKDFMQKLRAIVRYLGISDANMEEGNMRCDANISLREVGVKELGRKVEIKNLNSFKMVERAINHEIERQTELLETNTKIVQETRGWDDAKGKTISQREKEDALDYRYFPEPDLPPLVAEGDIEKRLKELLPELPQEKVERFVIEYDISVKDAEFLASDIDISKYFEKTIESLSETAESSEKAKNYAKKISNWIKVELMGRLNAGKIDFNDNKITPQSLAKLIHLIEGGTISGKIAKDVFDEMFTSGLDPEVIVREKGLEQVTDTGEIEKIIDAVISNNQKVVEEYKSGKVQVIGFLVGQVMKESGGKANPGSVNELLRNKLS